MLIYYWVNEIRTMYMDKNGLTPIYWCSCSRSPLTSLPISISNFTSHRITNRMLYKQFYVNKQLDKRLEHFHVKHSSNNGWVCFVCSLQEHYYTRQQQKLWICFFFIPSHRWTIVWHEYRENFYCHWACCLD